MRKIINLAVFLDGTWNAIESETNVFKMKQKIYEGSYPSDDDTVTFETLFLYEEGPGTTPNNNIFGGAFATDIPVQITNAYDWLTRVFSSYAGSSDVSFQIFLFGFSRGAYAAHILSWILSEYGIPQNYSKTSKYVNSYLKYRENRFPNDEFYFSFDIKMLGVWDVVSAPLDLYQQYHNGERAIKVKKIYHAMAANERRKLFQVMKYSNIDNNVRQIWFSGVHSDIGGGYPDDSTLSDIALDWMIQNATKEDLLFAPRQSNNLTALSLDFDNLHIHDEAPLSTPPNRRYEGELLHESLQARINKQNGIYKPDLIGFQLQNMIKPSIS